MPDHWEVQNYLNPLFNDAGLDPDGDGVSNLDEFLAGTNPLVNNFPPTTTTTTTATTATTTTGTTTTQASWDILPLFLAAVGGFSVAMVLAYFIHIKISSKRAS